MINNSLDVEACRATLLRDGRMQIRDFLQPDAAETLHDALGTNLPWAIAERGAPDRALADCDQQAQRELLAQAYDRARDGFHFVYDRYLILEAMKAGRDVGSVLHVVLQFFNSPEFLGFIRYLTGDGTLAMVGAQATRYRPGEFLRIHDDQHRGEGRRYAYVVNLSKAWEADWGGLLHFTDKQGEVTQTYVPWFNSLSLFKVPAEHHVGLVAPWALNPRLAITGWWHAATAQG